jgi:hypothetical protein
MVTIIRMSDKPCFLCNTTEDTAEVRFKDRSFSGVVCKNHLFQLMENRVQGAAKPKTRQTADQE